MANGSASGSLQRAGDSVLDAADEAARRGVDGLQPYLDHTLLKFSDVSITVGGVLAAVVALLVAIVVSAILRRALNRYGERQPNASRASLYTLSRVVHYAFIAVGLLLALEFIGIPVAKFTVFAGAIGVGLGFGLQAIFNNFISGLILLFDRSLKVGDFVELESGVHGEVQAIQIRSTRIVTNDNIDILVPNSEFVSGRVVNWTYRDVSRRIRIPFGVAYGTDKELVKKAALEAAAEVPFTLSLEGARRPQVWLVEFGDSSLNFELVTWLTAEATKRPATVKAAYLWALETALAQHGIEIPFPQRDLHLRSMFGEQGDAALAAFRRNAPPADEGGRQHEAAEVPALAHEERMTLSSNDATLDVQQGGAEVEEPAEREETTDNDARGH